MNCKQNKIYFRHLVLGLCMAIFSCKLGASGGNSTDNSIDYLDRYLKFEAGGHQEEAQKILGIWEPKNIEEESYKKYFLALSNKKAENFWTLYQELARSKRLLKLQHESIKNIIELDLTSEKSLTKDFKRFDKIAKKMLKHMQSQSDGLSYELLYLKWILKNNKIKELCRAERSRWLAQTSLKLEEVLQGLKTCEVSFDDFTYRLRMLIFSGEEKKAQAEITQYAENKKLAAWESAYLQAIYFSNVGDPTSAFIIAIPYESDIKENDTYYSNLFYISQRAGELAKSEEIINHLIKKSVNARKKMELFYQKAFLFYQTGRYTEANKILSILIQKHPSHRKRNKSKEYDNLTWLSSWCYYLAKDYNQARELLVKNKKWTSDKARNLYWLAQTEWALDNHMTALSYYRQLAMPVIRGEFFTYYNYLAWLRYHFRYETYKKDTDTESLQVLLKKQIDSIKVGRSAYALPDFSMTPTELLQEYQSYLINIGAAEEVVEVDPDHMEPKIDMEETNGIQIHTSAQLKNEMLWADGLIKWDYRDLALWHLYEVEKTLSNKSSAEPLIEYYSNNKYYNRALALASNVSTPAGKKLDIRTEPTLWNSLYPRAYEVHVEKEAKKRKIHPYLIWSIMKAETQYKANAISPVGAVGLMQFMPYTSQKVATLLKEDYQSNQLFNPETAIKYGAMYLKKLSDELGGEFPLIAAAYNGGPHRVKLWLKNFKESRTADTDMEYDVFIEHIPFAETRTYVKRVLSYNLTYQKLYEDKLDAKTSGWIIGKIPFKLTEPFVLKEEWPIN